MYLAVLTAVVGWAVFFGSWNLVFYGAGISVLFHAVVITVEEPTLHRRFGESYIR